MGGLSRPGIFHEGGYAMELFGRWRGVEVNGPVQNRLRMDTLSSRDPLLKGNSQFS
jgi:hypothetical protein